jgi:hypothetical protein
MWLASRVALAARTHTVVWVAPQAPELDSRCRVNRTRVEFSTGTDVRRSRRNTYPE